MYNKIKLNKKAQMGETITWVFATIIIIVILAISIFISSFYLGKFKKIQGSFFQTTDVLASKSLFSYVLTSDEGKSVYSELKEGRNLNAFNGKLALKIFRDFYQKDYGKIWLGVSINYFLPNDYFGDSSIGPNRAAVSNQIHESIKINETHSIEMMFWEKQ